MDTYHAILILALLAFWLRSHILHCRLKESRHQTEIFKAECQRQNEIAEHKAFLQMSKQDDVLNAEVIG